MSVIYYSDEELAGLLAALGGSDDVGEALVVLGIANRAAYMLTYGGRHDDDDTIHPGTNHLIRPAFTAPNSDVKIPVGEWTVSDWLDNLLYNCVSNGGRDFAPSDVVEFLQRKAKEVEAIADWRVAKAIARDNGIRGAERDTKGCPMTETRWVLTVTIEDSGDSESESYLTEAEARRGFHFLSMLYKRSGQTLRGSLQRWDGAVPDGPVMAVGNGRAL